MRTSNLHHHRPVRASRSAAFTLVELLVVITIVIALAALVFTLTNRARLAAAKATGINQMRSIGVAASSWASDNGRTEPFFFTNGTGDFPHESGGGGSKFTPGNPAKALYNVHDPDSGYLQNPGDFFSPLVKATPPSREDYDPRNASEKQIWGTYAWVHPYMTAATRGSRYPEISATFPAKVNRAAEGRYMMSESYAFSEPKFKKQIFHALMIDGSIEAIAESAEGYNKWKSGN
jgi:type II secretory pathway pseudopilin PulG